MVRAMTAGMIDFRQFDPWDAWAWRRLRWVLNDLELQQTQDVCRVQHQHWVTLASHSNLTTESFDNVKKNAGNAFNKYLKATYPWLADKIGEDGTRSEREEGLLSYQQKYGKPGEKHYEAMIDTLHAAFAKGPLNSLEKAADRKRRREAREAANKRG